MTANASAAKDDAALSLNQFTNLALKNSLRSRTSEESLASNRYGWLGNRRGLSWPTVSAAASAEKTFSDSDTGTETDARRREQSLSLSQPLLTGTNLTLNGAWTQTDSESDSFGIITKSRTRYSPVWTAGFTQPIFIFTGNNSWRAKREADLRWESDQDTYWKERLSIEFDARTLYYDLLLQSETAEVERKKFESSQLVNDTTRALVRAGKLAEVELVRADIRARKDERQIQNSENTLEKRMNDAKDLISMPQTQKIVLTSRLTYEPFNIPLAALQKAALENSPDLRSAQRDVELSEISLRRTREADHPAFNTSGSYAFTRDRSDPDLPVDPYTWTLKVGVDWPIFDASQSRLRKRQAELSLLNTKRSYENTQRQLAVNIENAYLEIKRTEQQIAEFGPQKESAERNVRAIRLQYRNGLTRLTDVFDAQNQMRELDLEYLSLLVSYNTARDRLKVLIGTDLDELAPKPRKKK